MYFRVQTAIFAGKKGMILDFGGEMSDGWLWNDEEKKRLRSMVNASTMEVDFGDSIYISNENIKISLKLWFNQF